jgi:hypothetical protein
MKEVKCSSHFGGEVFGVNCEKESGHGGLHTGGGTAWLTVWEDSKSLAAISRVTRMSRRGDADRQRLAVKTVAPRQPQLGNGAERQDTP